MREDLLIAAIDGDLETVKKIVEADPNSLKTTCIRNNTWLPSIKERDQILWEGTLFDKYQVNVLAVSLFDVNKCNLDVVEYLLMKKMDPNVLIMQNKQITLAALLPHCHLAGDKILEAYLLLMINGLNCDGDVFSNGTVNILDYITYWKNQEGELFLRIMALGALLTENYPLLGKLKTRGFTPVDSDVVKYLPRLLKRGFTPKNPHARVLREMVTRELIGEAELEKLAEAFQQANGVNDVTVSDAMTPSFLREYKDDLPQENPEFGPLSEMIAEFASHANFRETPRTVERLKVTDDDDGRKLLENKKIRAQLEHSETIEGLLEMLERFSDRIIILLTLEPAAEELLAQIALHQDLNPEQRSHVHKIFWKREGISPQIVNLVAQGATFIQERVTRPMQTKIGELEGTVQSLQKQNALLSEQMGILQAQLTQLMQVMSQSPSAGSGERGATILPFFSMYAGGRSEGDPCPASTPGNDHQ